MTPRAKPAPTRSCPECRYANSWHYSEDGKQSWRCPNYLAADLMKQAHKLTEAANEAATEAARRIVADAAETYPEFSANEIRDLIEAEGLSSHMGAAFIWASGKAGLIEGTGRRVMSRDPATRHKIGVWSSKVYAARVGGRTA